MIPRILKSQRIEIAILLFQFVTSILIFSGIFSGNIALIFSIDLIITSMMAVMLLYRRKFLKVLEIQSVDELAAKETLENFFSVSLEMLVVSGFDDRFKIANPAFWQALGYTREELFEMSVLSFVHPDDLELTNDEIKRQLAGGDVINFTNRWRCKSGDYIWIRWTSRPMGNYMYSAARNVSESIEEKRQLRADKDRLSEAQTLAKVGSWSYEIDKDLLVWSAETSRIYGFTAESKTLSLAEARSFTLEEYRERNLAISRASIVNGEPYQTDYEILDVTGERRFLHGRGQAFKNASGVLTHIIGTVQDITERKMIEQDLRIAQVAAQQASIQKSTFLANMSHEIRTPINGIVGMNDLMAGTLLDAEQRDYCETIKASSESLLTIINDILDFSKIEAGKLNLDSFDFDFNNVIKETILSLKPLAVKKGLSLNFIQQSDCEKFLLGDAGRVRQLVTNLLGNAIKFTSEGSIQVIVKAAGINRVRCEIADTGIGISEAAIKRLFNPFEQADASTSRSFGGTGLGLSICRSLVELMNGDIGATSELGNGSTFWFEIELPKGKPSAAEVKSVGVDKIDRHHRILIAEDNMVNQRIISTILTKAGYTSQAVASGLEVIDLMKRIDFDLILMDCQMPEMDGYEATSAIREKETSSRFVPIIAMTANAINGDKEKCLAVGMNDYISKPYKTSEVLQKIDYWLKKAS